MLSPVEDFWLRWHVAHDNVESAGRARLVLEAETGGSPGQVAASLGLSSQAAEGVLATFELERLATFPRAKVRLEQLTNLDAADSRARQHVARQTRRLFSDTLPLHHLPRKARQLLEAAALLPPIEATAGTGAVAQREPVLLDGAILADLSATDQTIIACVLHLQRKGYRPNRDPLFTQLRPYQQSQVRYLAALLQVCELLDHSGTHTTDLKGAELLDDAVQLRLLGAEAEADGAYACRRAGLWQPIFHCDLRHALGPRSAATQLPEVAAQPDEPVGAVFTRLMKAGLSKWQASLPGALSGDLASLTDLLSGLEQTRATLGAFASVLKRHPVKAVKHPLSRLRGQLAAYLTGQAALGDLDAYVAGRQPAATAELQPMREAWERDGRRRYTALRTTLESAETAALLSNLTQLAQTPPLRRRKATTIHLAAPVLLDELCAEVAEREASVSADRPDRYRRYQDGLARLTCALEALGGKASMGEEAEQMLADVQRLENRIDRWLVSSVLNDAIAEFLDEWAEKQARRKAPQLFGTQAVLAYRQARRAQWFRLRGALAADWRPLRASRLRRRANSLLKQLARHDRQ